MPGFCNVSQQASAEAASNRCQWPRDMTLRWTVVDTVPGFSLDYLVDVYRQSWQLWADVCDLRVEYTGTPGAANILVGSRRIDGPAGVLAEAELPCGRVGPSTKLRVWADTSDRWVVADNPPPGKVDLGRVMAHEFGHSLGIGHEENGQVDALMDPTVSRIQKPQRWDIDQAVLRYGMPSTPGGNDEDDDLVTLCEAFTDCCNKLAPAVRKLVKGLMG